MLLGEASAQRLRDGTLQFTLTGWKRTRFVIEPWERGLAAHSIKSQVRRPSQLWSVVIVPSGTDRPPGNPAVDAFVSRIPAIARAIVRPYLFGQFLLLQSLAVHGEIEEPPPVPRARVRSIAGDEALAFHDAYPSPPLPGTSDIVPIATLSALKDEAKAQRNCVVGCAKGILAGELYLYRVLRPQRATLEIVFDEDEWEFGQLKLACNKEPSRDTFAFVERWVTWARREAMKTSVNR